MESTKTKKYTMAQGLGFMLQRAMRYRARTIFYCLLIAAAQLLTNLTELYVVPSIISMIERRVSVQILLGAIAAFTLALFALKWLGKYVEILILPSQIEVRTGIIAEISRKGCCLSYPSTLEPTVKRLMEQALSNTDSNAAASENIWSTLTSLLVSLSGFVVYLILLRNMDPLLLLIVLLTATVSFLFHRSTQQWEYLHRKEEGAHERALRYVQEQMFSTKLAKDIRIFGLGSWLQDVSQRAAALYLAFLHRRERRYIAVCAADFLLTVARSGLAYFYLIRMTLRQGLPVSDFLLYFSAVSGFTTWITGIMRDFSTLRHECMEINQIQEYLDYPEVFRFSGGKPIPHTDRWELRLEDVSFRYPGADRDTIHHMNLTVHAGEKLAVVGLNGAGKTTLVKLLCGFFDPDQGRVLLNGQDIREFNRQDYYALLSAVFQDFSVLDSTLAENVSQVPMGADRERVLQCLEKAGLSQAVADMPKGIDTHIGRKVYLDGTELSGGQLQRLMLARALYKDGPILVLDEPTAALDPLAENDIYQKYSAMTQGKTSLFISHRLASTQFCDRILYLEDGRIAEEGTHTDLLAKGGGYAKLFTVQSQYYQEGSEPHVQENL